MNDESGTVGHYPSLHGLTKPDISTVSHAQAGSTTKPSRRHQLHSPTLSATRLSHPKQKQRCLVHRKLNKDEKRWELIQQRFCSFFSTNWSIISGERTQRSPVRFPTHIFQEERCVVLFKTQACKSWCLKAREQQAVSHSGFETHLPKWLTESWRDPFNCVKGIWFFNIFHLLSVLFNWFGAVISIRWGGYTTMNKYLCSNCGRPVPSNTPTGTFRYTMADRKDRTKHPNWW